MIFNENGVIFLKESVIENYYISRGLNKKLAKLIDDRFDDNPDIKKEFEYWIKNKSFMKSCIEIDGYTAEKLSKEFPVHDSFELLINLRINPERAHKQIERGFVIK